MSWPTTDPDYQDWLNELLEFAPEHYDGDDAAEAIVVRYVRDLEAVAAAARQLAPSWTRVVRDSPYLQEQIVGVESALATLIGQERSEGECGEAHGESYIPCCAHCGCEGDERIGHDDTCKHGCNDAMKERKVSDFPKDLCGHCLGPKTGTHPRFCEACVSRYAEVNEPTVDHLAWVEHELTLTIEAGTLNEMMSRLYALRETIHVVRRQTVGQGSTDAE